MVNLDEPAAPTSPELNANASELEDSSVRDSKESNTSSVEPDLPRKRTTIQSLPNELLFNIFSNFDVITSEEALYDEPALSFTQSKTPNLKSISSVSKRWRETAIPILYKCAQIVVKSPREQSPFHETHLLSFIEFVTQAKLSKVVTRFTLIVYDNKLAINSSLEVSKNGFSAFWSALFEVIDPTDLVVAAPAEALGALTSCHVALDQTWRVDCPCHYLRLQRPPTEDVTPNLLNESLSSREIDTVVGPAIDSAVASSSFQDTSNTVSQHTAAHNESGYLASSRSTASSSSSPVDIVENSKPHSLTIFEIRPWTKLLLNEGSFIRLFATYDEIVSAALPSILPDLLGAGSDSRGSLMSPTIREMEYVAIFPTWFHFSTLSTNLPRLDRLYVQIVPRNDIMLDPEKMEKVEEEVLWHTRNSSYALIVREIFSSPLIGNYKHLRIFESGDAADKNAFEAAIEFMKRDPNGWKVTGEGVFERDTTVSGDGISGSYEGALIRWGWNGTAVLPYSSFGLYFT